MVYLIQQINVFEKTKCTKLYGRKIFSYIFVLSFCDWYCRLISDIADFSTLYPSANFVPTSPFLNLLNIFAFYPNERIILSSQTSYFRFTSKLNETRTSVIIKFSKKLNRKFHYEVDKGKVHGEGRVDKINRNSVSLTLIITSFPKLVFSCYCFQQYNNREIFSISRNKCKINK